MQHLPETVIASDSSIIPRLRRGSEATAIASHFVRDDCFLHCDPILAIPY